MKIKINTCCAVVIFLACFQGWSQSQNENALYKKFDDKAGKKNLGINNGTVHINTYKFTNNSHRYLLDKYVLGSVFYDGQLYTGYNLKYDVYQDVLIAKVDGENNNTGINLITAKVDYFAMDGKQFVNLNTAAKQEFAKGFYEEIDLGNLQLYIKHHKNRLEVVKTDGNYSRFDTSENFVLHYNGRWYPINSQNAVASIFPEQEKNIADFYATNSSLKNTDPKQFMRNLITSLHLQLQK